MFSRPTVYSDEIRAAIISWIVEGKIDINDLISNEETVFNNEIEAASDDTKKTLKKHYERNNDGKKQRPRSTVTFIDLTDEYTSAVSDSTLSESGIECVTNKPGAKCAWQLKEKR